MHTGAAAVALVRRTDVAVVAAGRPHQIEARVAGFVADVVAFRSVATGIAAVRAARAVLTGITAVAEQPVSAGRRVGDAAVAKAVADVVGAGIAIAAARREERGEAGVRLFIADIVAPGRIGTTGGAGMRAHSTTTGVDTIAKEPIVTGSIVVAGAGALPRAVALVAVGTHVAVVTLAPGRQGGAHRGCASTQVARIDAAVGTPVTVDGVAVVTLFATADYSISARGQ
jgi:hypothetical protein